LLVLQFAEAALDAVWLRLICREALEFLLKFKAIQGILLAQRVFLKNLVGGLSPIGECFIAPA
jgi:hypothetical protein